MALANTAWIPAANGKRVLAMDWGPGDLGVLLLLNLLPTRSP